MTQSYSSPYDDGLEISLRVPRQRVGQVREGHTQGVGQVREGHAQVVGRLREGHTPASGTGTRGTRAGGVTGLKLPVIRSIKRINQRICFLLKKAGQAFFICLLQHFFRSTVAPIG